MRSGSRLFGPGTRGRSLRRFLSAVGIAAASASSWAQPLDGPGLGAPPPEQSAPTSVAPPAHPGGLASPALERIAAPQSRLRPIGHSERDLSGAHDAHIAAMPTEYKELEVIHHRSQLVVTRQNVRRFAITDPSVIEIVQYAPHEFAIIGNGRGTTDLMIWYEGEETPVMYLVTVIPDPALEDRRRLDYGRIERKLALLYPNSKVYLIPMSRKIIVRGQARDSEEAARIMQIVRDEVVTQDGALFAGYAGGDAAAGDLPGRSFNTNDLLSSLVVNELQVPGEYQVMVRVRIAELSRSMLREFGINWNSLVEISGDQVSFGSNLGGGNVVSFSGVFEDFTINTLIDALASNGTVKIMEDAALVSLAGESAAFLSGGEFAVPSTVGLQGVGVATTTFRGFGTSIIVTPTIVDNDLIRLQIVPELSQISGQNAVGGIPGLNVKRVQTRVELREGQTIVLGGLFARQQQVEQTRIPLLGELPIIGSTFFSSKRATEDEKELLIVVTPEIIRPVDADQQPPMPGWYVTHPDDIDFYHLNRTEGAPDLGHYQLLPIGNGQGYAQDVGYNFYNPAPVDGQLGPAPTGGAYGPAYGAYADPGMNGYYPGAVYGDDPYSQGYTPNPAQPATPLMPQQQYDLHQQPQMTPIPQQEPVIQYPAAQMQRGQPPMIQQTGAQQNQFHSYQFQPPRR
jgi:pilus assembly protein CpaC